MAHLEALNDSHAIAPICLPFWYKQLGVLEITTVLELARQSIYKDRLAIARRLLVDRIVIIVSSTRVLVSCVVGFSLGCIGVVPTTVRERATPDSIENKQADAGNCLSRRYFLCGALLLKLFASIA